MSSDNAEWMEALAAEVEPADVLILRPDQPAIEESRVKDSNEAVALVGDDRWVLSAMGRTPGQSPVTLIFASARDTGVIYHPERSETLKRIAYLLINWRVPATVALAPDSKGVVDYVSASGTRQILHAIRRFMEWAHENFGAETLSDCTLAVMDRYHTHLAQQGNSDGNVRGELHPLYRVSQMAKWLPANDRLPTPSWRWKTPGNGRVEVNPPGSATPIIEPDVFDPLLSWSLSFVRDFGPDILAARDLIRERLASARSAPKSEVFEWMRQYVAETGGRFPALPRQRLSHPVAALMYLSYLSGIDHASLRAWYKAKDNESRAFRNTRTLDASMRCPVGVRISGTLHDGLPWTDDLDFHDVVPGGGSRDTASSPPLIQHLRTACFAVLGILSGCRPQELRLLPREGCLIEVPPPEPGGIVGYLLQGVIIKGKDEGGEETVWATIKPGAEAVAVAAALAEDSPWLFPDPSGAEPIRGGTLNTHLLGFIRYVNALPVRERLPTAFRIGDEHGASLTSRQFRRTSSWHIESQPDGEFALGVQFQHASTTLGRDGYASTRDAGVRKMMNAEAAAAQRNTLVAVSESILGGAGVSGPSAQRLMAAAQLAVPLRAEYVPPQTLKQILSETDAQVYDNPSQHSLCVYVPARAKCAGSDEEPDRGSCVIDCANHARTDMQIDVLSAEVEQYRVEAASPLAPEPVRMRLLQVAEDGQHRIEEHHRTRRFLPIIDVTATVVGGERDASA